uniref:Uncharacterized protein n=1 Tax=Oryza barthii TaxID=65489 RepID=A0A0D3EV97_9ORYZ
MAQAADRRETSGRRSWMRRSRGAGWPRGRGWRRVRCWRRAHPGIDGAEAAAVVARESRQLRSLWGIGFGRQLRSLL